MAKGMCLIKSNELISTLQTHSSSIILSGWAVVYPDKSTSSLPLCLEVCVGRGSRAPQPVTKVPLGIPTLV